MSKRKDLIISRYQDLKKELSEYIDDSLFPSLDDFELSDVIFFINMYFPKYTDDHSQTIKNLLNTRINL